MYRERTETPERISGWHPLIVKCVAITWLATLALVWAAAIWTARQIFVYEEISANESKLRLEKFELEHPPACADRVLSGVTFGDPEP
jgi:hypothetical protein